MSPISFRVRYKGKLKFCQVVPTGRGDEVALYVGNSVLCCSVNFSRLVVDARNELGINVLK